ncbi:TPA: hypothetical protein ACGO30_001687 [Streptococcus suis]
MHRFFWITKNVIFYCLILIFAGVMILSFSSVVLPKSNLTSSKNQPKTMNVLEERLVAESEPINFENPQYPANLSEALAEGGYVVVFRYTGAGGGTSKIPPKLDGKVIDDGQRISTTSIERMLEYGNKVKQLDIQIDHILSSEYYFVWQHAEAAFDLPIEISRDLTGSLNFNNEKELENSLQNLRNRVVKVPESGKSTFLFTHQGKFDKAFGFYPPAGTTIIFKPDGSSRPQLIAVLSFEEFLQL